MDSEYLKEHVGQALTTGLAEVTQKKPADPIDFLSHWLRKFVQNREDQLKAAEKDLLLIREREQAEQEKRRNEAMLEEQNQIANDILKREEDAKSASATTAEEENSKGEEEDVKLESE